MLASDASVRAALADVGVAVGTAPADLVLRGGQLVNVWSREIYVADVAIRRDRIVAIRERYDGVAASVIDCSGQLILPGFIEPLDDAAAALSQDELALLLLPHGITCAVVSSHGAGQSFRALRLAGGPEAATVIHRPLRRMRPCATMTEVLDAVAVGETASIGLPSDPATRESLLTALAATDEHECRAVMLRQCAFGTEAAREPRLRPVLADAIAAGLTPVGIAELASFNAAAHFGLDHEIGSIAPGRRADIAVFDALSATYPAFVIAGGAIVARQGFLEASSPEGAGR